MGDLAGARGPVGWALARLREETEWRPYRNSAITPSSVNFRAQGAFSQSPIGRVTGHHADSIGDIVIKALLDLKRADACAPAARHANNNNDSKCFT